jgi:hypothetical protein
MHSSPAFPWSTLRCILGPMVERPASAFGLLVASCLSANPAWNEDVGPTSGSVATDSTSQAASETLGGSTSETGTSTSASETASTETDGSGGEVDAYAAIVLADQPVGYWRLGDPAPPLAAEAVQGKDGTYLGDVIPNQPGLVVGSDTAAAFPGGNNHIRVADVFGFAGRVPFSVELWVLQESDDAGCLIGKSHYTGSEYQGWFIASHDGRIRFDRPPGGNANGEAPPVGEPFHLAVTYDGINAVVYFDGERVGSRVMEVDIDAHAEPLLIGDCGDWGGFAGVLDEVALYDRMLTAEEIARHAMGGRGS